MEAAGQEVAALKNRPFLTAWTKDYYQAFQVLLNSRPVGMGVGAIPLSEMVAYCQLYAIDDLDERDRFVKMMKALDAEYLRWFSEQQKERQKQKSQVGAPTMPGRGGGGPRRRG